MALAAQAVFLRTLAPTVTSEDSGELITAAYRLGVAHPPGFPLWCLLGRLFCLLPAAPAWCVNLLSSVLGAACAGVLYLVGRRLGLHPLAAAGGALCLAFSRRFWSQSVIAEVYTLNALLLAAVLLALLSWRASRRTAHLYAAAALFGLGLANHYMLTLLVAPALAGFVLLVEPAIVRRGRVLLAVAAIVAATLALYAYLPLAAAADPPLNWGDPSSPQRFVDHVTRAQYRSLEQGRLVSPATKLRFAGHFAGLLWEQFTPWLLLPLALAGWGVLGRRRGTRPLLAGIFLLDSLGLIALLQFTFEQENRTRVEEYYLPAYLCVALLLGAGLQRLWEVAAASARPRTATAAAAAACLAAPLFPLVAHGRVNDMSAYWLAHDNGRAILESLEPEAVYFPSGDFTAFPALYLQACEGVRPDVILAEITGGLSPRARAYLAGIDPGADPALLAAAQRAMLGGPRPVYASAKSSIADRSGLRFDPWGLVYRVRPSGAPPTPPAPDVFEPAPLRNLARPTVVDDLGASLLADYHLMRGEALVARGERERAAEAFRVAASFASRSKEALNNLGSTCAEHGLDALAEELFRRAADLYPDYLTARRNLARLLESTGRTAEAIEVYERLRELEPDRADLPLTLAVLYNNLGNRHAERGETDEALECYGKAIAADPGYALVHKNLALLYREALGDPERARAHLERYREMTARAPR